MNVQETFRNAIVQMLIEWPAKRQTFERMAQRLERAGQRLEDRLSKVEGTDKQKRVLCHIIGIERWGQRRLWRATRLRGAPVRSEEAAFSDKHHAYKPETSTSWVELMAKFRAVRQETVALSRYLAEADVNETLKVPHNSLGPLSLRGWLRYLRTHAAIEGRKIH